MSIQINQSINDPDLLVVKGLHSDSRLQMFDVLKDNNSEYYFNIFKNYTMPDSIKDNDLYFDIYVIDNDDWWDNISAHFYDTSTLWWLICYTNDVKNPFEEIEAGQIIKIFKKEYYYEIIKQIKEVYKL